MKFRSDKEIEKEQAIVARLTYDYVAICIAERMVGQNKVADDSLSIMRNAVPELSKPEIVSLFDVINIEPEVQNETKERFDEMVAEYSRQYGFHEIIMRIFAKMDPTKAESLLARITNLGNARLAYAKAVQSIEEKCDGISSVLSLTINSIAACSMSIPANSQPEMMAHLRSLESLRTKLKALREPFRDAEVEDSMNKVNIAGMKLDELLDLVSNALKKANDFMSRLEQKNILRKGEVGIVSIAQYSSQDDMIRIMDSVEKLVGTKGHPTKV